MSSLILDLGYPQNWDNIYSQTITAQTSGNGTTYTPIPPIVVPILLEKPIAATLITLVQPAKPHWRFAGFLNQIVRTGIVVGGSPNANAVTKRKLYLNNLTLHLLPKLSDTYALSIELPFWFQSAQVNVWEYSGSVEDSTELLVKQVLAKFN